MSAIKDIFERDINRNINGVVKVNQNKGDVVYQELDEYVVTKELNGHIRKFFDNYQQSFMEKTDKVGVWVSGFFGSGKSHFLKILGYVLQEKVKLVRSKRVGVNEVFLVLVELPGRGT